VCSLKIVEKWLSIFTSSAEAVLETNGLGELAANVHGSFSSPCRYPPGSVDAKEKGLELPLADTDAAGNNHQYSKQITNPDGLTCKKLGNST